MRVRPVDPNSPGDATPVLSVAATRAVDRHAIGRLGLPGIVLMEHAALGAAEVVGAALDRLGPAAAAVIVRGPGNNGGDGSALARILHERGRAARVLTAGDPKPGTDAAVNDRVARALGLAVEPLEPGAELVERGGPAVVVDAVLGTGLSRPAEGPAADAIAAIGRARAPGRHGARAWVVALDVPSGLDADTGTAAGPAVSADETVTFAAVKLGLLTPGARPRVGRLWLASIGLADAEVARLGGGAH